MNKKHLSVFVFMLVLAISMTAISAADIDQTNSIEQANNDIPSNTTQLNEITDQSSDLQQSSNSHSENSNSVDNSHTNSISSDSKQSTTSNTQSNPTSDNTNTATYSTENTNTNSKIVSNSQQVTTNTDSNSVTNSQQVTTNTDSNSVTNSQQVTNRDSNSVTNSQQVTNTDSNSVNTYNNINSDTDSEGYIQTISDNNLDSNTNLKQDTVNSEKIVKQSSEDIQTLATPITISLDDIDCYYGDTVLFNVVTEPVVDEGIFNFYIDNDFIDFRNISENPDPYEFNTSAYGPGVYTITVDYSGSIIYENTYTYAQLTINKLPTSLVIESSEFNDDNNIDLTFNIYSFDEKLDSGTLEIYYGDTLIESLDLTSTDTSITLDKKYNYEVLEFKYYLDKYHDEIDISELINVAKIKSSIYVPYISGYVGSNVTASVSIQTSRLVNDGKLDVYIDDTLIGEYDVTTDSFDIIIDLSKYTEGNYTARFDYVDSDVFTDSSYTTNLKVSKIKTTLYAYDLSTHRNSLVNITSRVYNYVDDTNDGLIEFFIDDESIYTQVVTDNIASVEYLIPDTLEYGEHELLVVYYGTNRYSESSNSATITISKYSSKLTLKNASLTNDGQIELNFNIYSYNKTVEDGVIDVYIDGQLVTTVEVTDNNTKIVLPEEYTPDNSYDLHVEYHDSDWFDDATLDDVVEVNKITTSTRPYAYISSNILTVNGYVYASNYDTINEGSVEYYLDGVLIDTVAVEDNKAVLVYDMTDYDAGNYTITATYTGSVVYAVSTNTTSIEKTISQKTVYITTNSTIRATPATTIILNATLADYDGNLAEGTVKATITIDNQSVTTEFVDGILTYTFTIPENATEGNYTITITTENTTNYKNATRNITLKIARNYTYISAYNTIYATKGNSVQINATLYSNDGIVTDKTPAIIKINDKLLANTYFEDGVLQYTLDLGNTYLSDSYTLTIIAQETNTYSESTKSINLTLNKRYTYISSSNVYSKSGDKVVITGTVYDSLTKQPITGTSKVCIKINEVTLETFTIENGYFIYEYYNNYSAKTYNITIISGENSMYNNSTWQGYLIVNNSYLKIATQNIQTPVKSSINITAQLLYNDELINDTLKTAIKIDDITIAELNVSDGIINLPFELTDAYAGGTHTITIKTGTSSGYVSATSISQLILTKQNRQIATENIVADQSSTVHIKANITDENGEIITSSTKVNIKIGGVSILTDTITGGEIDFEYTLPDSMKAGYYDVLIQVGETSIYNHATTYATLKVE